MNVKIFVALISPLILFTLITVPVFATKQDPTEQAATKQLATEQDLLELILTPHYGILTTRDLEMYANRPRPIKPFDPKKPSGRENWQCFDSKNISVSYHSWVDDEITGEHNCDMHVRVMKNNEIIHDYGLRRALPVEYCIEKNALWNKIIKNQPYTCLGGIYVGEKKKLLPGATVKVKGWVFDKIKTKEDYDSYFDD